MYKIGWYAASSFWLCVNLCIYAMSAVAFVYRIMDLQAADPQKQAMYRMRAFRTLLP